MSFPSDSSSSEIFSSPFYGGDSLEEIDTDSRSSSMRELSVQISEDLSLFLSIDFTFDVSFFLD